MIQPFTTMPLHEENESMLLQKGWYENVDSSCTHNSQKPKIIQIYKYKRIEKQTMAPSIQCHTSWYK